MKAISLLERSAEGSRIRTVGASQLPVFNAWYFERLNDPPHSTEHVHVT